MNLFGSYNRLLNISSGTWNIWLVHQQINSSHSLETRAQWALQSEGLLLLIFGMSLYSEANVTAILFVFLFFLFFFAFHFPTSVGDVFASADREPQRCGCDVEFIHHRLHCSSFFTRNFVFSLKLQEWQLM